MAAPRDASGALRQNLAARSARRRLIVAAALGLVAAAACTFAAPWQLSTMVGWIVTAAAFVVWVWAEVGKLDADATRAHATTEDGSRVATQLLLISASVASLAGTGAVLVKASQAHGAGKVALTLAGVVTVAVSWAVVQTVFALRYAHEFYTPPVGGIDFKNHGHELPDYQDFAFVAFTVGMTFQVSDTDIQARVIRRSVLRHALLAYLFGAVILAVTVNVIAGVIQ